MNDKGEAVRWLIEEVGEQNTEVIYYFGIGSFTSDAWVAMPFETEKEANQFITDNKETFIIHRVKAIEHMFLN